MKNVSPRSNYRDTNLSESKKAMGTSARDAVKAGQDTSELNPSEVKERLDRLAAAGDSHSDEGQESSATMEHMADKAKELGSEAIHVMGAAASTVREKVSDLTSGRSDWRSLLDEARGLMRERMYNSSSLFTNTVILPYLGDFIPSMVSSWVSPDALGSFGVSCPRPKQPLDETAVDGKGKRMSQKRPTADTLAPMARVDWAAIQGAPWSIFMAVTSLLFGFFCFFTLNAIGLTRKYVMPFLQSPSFQNFMENVRVYGLAILILAYQFISAGVTRGIRLFRPYFQRTTASSHHPQKKTIS